MKVAELEGVLLDYWVARAEDLLHPHIDDGLCWVEEPACDGDPAGALDTGVLSCERLGRWRPDHRA